MVEPINLLTKRMTGVMIFICSLNICVYPQAQDEQGDQGIQHQYLQKGDFFLGKDNFDSSLYFFELAYQHFENENSWQGIVEALTGISANLIQKQKNNEADSILNYALEIAEKHLEKENPEIGDVYYYLGRVHGRSDRPQKSREAFQHALDIYDSYPEPLKIKKQRVYRSMGRLYYRTLKVPLEGKKYFEKTLEILQSMQDPNHLQIAVIYYYIGSISREIGDYEKAISYMQASLNEYRKIPLERRPPLFNILIVIGNIYLEWQRFDLAVNNYYEAINLLIESGENLFRLSEYYHNLSNAYVELGEPDSIIKYALQSIKIIDEFDNLSRNSEDYGVALRNLGYGYFLKNNYSLAQKYLEESQEVFSKNAQNNISTLISLGELYAEKNQFNTGLNYLQEALFRRSEGFNDMDILKSPTSEQIQDPISVIKVSHLKARYLKELFLINNNPEYLEASLYNYQLTDTLLYLNKVAFDTQGAQLFFTENIKNIYEGAIDCAVRLHKVSNDMKYMELAHSFFEKTKSRLLFENLQATIFIKTSDIPDSLLSLDKSLKIELAYNQQLLNDELVQNDSVRINEIQSRVFEIMNQQKELDEYLTENYPALKRTIQDEEVISLDKTREISSNRDACIVEYFWGDSTLYVISVFEDEVKLGKRPLTDELLSALNMYSSQLRIDPEEVYNTENFNLFKSSSQKVFKSILEPFLPEKPFKKMIIVPDGLLTSLPFESLVTGDYKFNEVNYKALPYLILEYIVQYGHSVTLLNQNLKAEKKIRKPSVLAFAYTGDYETEIQNSLSRNEAGNLPGTFKEVQGLRKYYKNGEFIVGHEASEVNFKSLAQKYDILHLAVHGKGDEHDILSSKLIFRKNKNSNEDGQLYAYEMYSLDLNASLAVLSACETGIGKLQEGEGVFNLARGFILSGCPAIIMSQWKIHDETSARIMEAFYKFLSEGNSADEALRKARLEYMESSNEFLSHPTFWAAFVHYGNTPTFNPVAIKSWWFILGGFVIIVVSWGIYYWLKKRKPA